MSKTRVERRIHFASLCHSPSCIFYVGAVFTRASAQASTRHLLFKAGHAIGWLSVVRSLPKESGSPTVGRANSRSACQLSSPIIRQRAPINSEISVIIAALTLALMMAGFGCSMCPLDVLRPSIRTYIKTRPVCIYIQTRDYGHLFSVPLNPHDLTRISRLDY